MSGDPADLQRAEDLADRTDRFNLAADVFWGTTIALGISAIVLYSLHRKKLKREAPEVGVSVSRERRVRVGAHADLEPRSESLARSPRRCFSSGGAPGSTRPSAISFRRTAASGWHRALLRRRARRRRRLGIRLRRYGLLAGAGVLRAEANDAQRGLDRCRSERRLDLHAHGRRALVASSAFARWNHLRRRLPARRLAPRAAEQGLRVAGARRLGRDELAHDRCDRMRAERRCDRYAGVVLSVATDSAPGSKLQDELAVTLHAGGLVLVTQADVEVARASVGVDENVDVAIELRPTLDELNLPILNAR